MEGVPQAEAVPKRRRIRGKSAPIAGYDVLPPAPVAAGGADDEAGEGPDLLPHQIPSVGGRFVPQWPPLDAFFGWAAQKQYHCLCGIVRSFYIHTILNSTDDPSPQRQDQIAARVVALRGSFSRLSADERSTLAHSCSASCNPPRWLVTHLENLFVKRRGRPMCLKRARTKQILCTFIGPWTLRDGDGAPREFPDMSMDDAEAVVKACPDMQALWDKFKTWCTSIKTTTLATDFACCLEICPEVFSQTKTIKLNLHCFLKGDSWLIQEDRLAFGGISCYKSAALSGLPLGRARNSFVGFLYCSLDVKVGTVWTFSTKRPFKDFQVRPDWLASLAACGKLKYRDARQLVNRCISGSQRVIRDLDGCQEQLEADLIAEDMAMVRRHCQVADKPWRQIPVVLEWSRQYELVQSRYRFLVLEGASCMGKTKFARSLLRPGHAPDQILEVTCTAGQEPNIRSFDYSWHKLIIYDEISPATVAGSRRIFQAAEGWVDVSCSATNMWSKKKCVWRVPMICCTNLWSSLLSTLPKADADWVIANQMYVHVDAPLWVQDGDEAGEM